MTHPAGQPQVWVVAIEGKAAGECVVTVTDSKTQKTVEIGVTVKPAQMPAYEHLVSGGTIGDIEMKDAKMRTGLIVAVVGDNADKAELAIKECDLPFVRVEKHPLKTFVEGKVQEFILTVAANQDLYPRELKMRLKYSGKKIDFMVKQPATTIEKCYNFLAYFAQANLKTFTPWESASKPGAGSFAEVPEKGNMADWNTTTKAFGEYFQFPETGNKPYKNWRAKIGKYTYKIPNIDELALYTGRKEIRVTPRIYVALKELNGDKKWKTALRYEKVEAEGSIGLKITARYLTGAMPSKEELKKDSFWTDPEKVGSDVIRYFPYLGYKSKDSAEPNTTHSFHYWSSSESEKPKYAKVWQVKGLNDASTGQYKMKRKNYLNIRVILSLDD